MKYILIPIFRVVWIFTLAAVFSFMLIVLLASCIWDGKIDALRDIFTDGSAFDGLWRSDDYRASGGKSGYYYKTFFHYIINKKTYANG